MSTLTKSQYEEQAKNCNNLCVVSVTNDQINSGEMPCVTCPFCKEVVTAKLTKTTISCPECKTTVSR